MIFLKKKAITRVNNLVFVLILTLIINPYFAPPIYAQDGTQAQAQPQPPTSTVPVNQPAPAAPALNPTTPTQPFPTTLGPPNTNPLSPAPAPATPLAPDKTSTATAPTQAAEQSLQKSVVAMNVPPTPKLLAKNEKLKAPPIMGYPVEKVENIIVSGNKIGTRTTVTYGPFGGDKVETVTERDNEGQITKVTETSVVGTKKTVSIISYDQGKKISEQQIRYEFKKDVWVETGGDEKTWLISGGKKKFESWTRTPGGGLAVRTTNYSGTNNNVVFQERFYIEDKFGEEILSIIVILDKGQVLLARLIEKHVVKIHITWGFSPLKNGKFDKEEFNKLVDKIYHILYPSPLVYSAGNAPGPG